MLKVCPIAFRRGFCTFRSSNIQGRSATKVSTRSAVVEFLPPDTHLSGTAYRWLAFDRSPLVCFRGQSEDRVKQLPTSSVALGDKLDPTGRSCYAANYSYAVLCGPDHVMKRQMP